MQGWMKDGACQNAPAPVQDAFFDEEADPGTALALCAACPVRLRCLEYALTAPEDWGIWGGTLPAERKTLLRQRRGRAA